MAEGQVVRQAELVVQNTPNPTQVTEKFALYLADGTPVDLEALSTLLSDLDDRVTALETPPGP